MANSFDLSGLKNFQKKLEKVKERKELFKDIVYKLCELGTTYAKALYSSSKSQKNKNPITVSYNILSDGHEAKIVADGTQIAYLEFGTGERGRGTYDGKLPDVKFRFFSERLGYDVKLYGWTYSYANYLDDTQEDWGGFEAQAQMWKTSQYLRRMIPQIIKEVTNNESIS